MNPDKRSSRQEVFHKGTILRYNKICGRTFALGSFLIKLWPECLPLY